MEKQMRTKIKHATVKIMLNVDMFAGINGEVKL